MVGLLAVIALIYIVWKGFFGKDDDGGGPGNICGPF